MEFAQLCAVGMKETQGQMVIQRPQRYDQQLQGMEKENEWRAGDPGLSLEEHPVKQGSVWFWNHLRYDYHVSLLRQNMIKTKLALAISPATQKKSLKKNIVAIESCWSIIIRQKGASSRARFTQMEAPVHWCWWIPPRRWPWGLFEIQMKLLCTFSLLLLIIFSNLF